MPPLAASLILVLFALLGWAMVTDLRHRTIGNRLNAGIAALAPVWWWASGVPLPGIAWRVALAAMLLLVFVALFAVRAMGGGDVKLIAAVALWLPPALVMPMLWWMSVAGGVLTAAMLVAHRRRGGATAPEVPYGLAIAGATIGVLANHILTNPAA